MPIHYPTNQYRGINAHLHSEFQTERDSPSMWPAFHAAHISHLADALNEVLPPQYQAVEEQSLHINTADPRTIRPRPDITVYDAPAGAQPGGHGLAMLTPTWEATIDETMVEREEIQALVIYRTAQAAIHERLGDPVVRIELFSPSNKAGGDYFKPYQNNRQLALHSGLVLVEIDYLHETASPIPGFPHYPDEDQSYPYNIIISDPRLPPEQTAVFSYGFGVDVPVPSLNIPLSGADMVRLDFDAAYQRTFVARRWGKQVDYEQEPERIESYREDDRAAIRVRMAAVQAGS